jgi:hypothetical protein
MKETVSLPDNSSDRFDCAFAGISYFLMSSYLTVKYRAISR